jgi:Flp pilus assembly protein TadD
MPQSNLVPEIVSALEIPPKPAGTTRLAHTRHPATKVSQVRNNKPVHVEQHQDDPIDPLLNNAYLAYRSGKFEQAQQLYQEALKLDERNIDALLGLGVIAQRGGKDNLAAHYYAQALAIEPACPP